MLLVQYILVLAITPNYTSEDIYSKVSWTDSANHIQELLRKRIINNEQLRTMIICHKLATDYNILIVLDMNYQMNYTEPTCILVTPVDLIASIE